MIERRSYKISNRIFTLDDIKKLALELEKEYKKIIRGQKNSHGLLNFSIYYTDGSEYETEDTKLFNQNIISTKKVYRIKFRFIDYKQNNSILLELTHGDKYYTNELQISGSNSDWVNGCLTRLKELIEASQPQFNLVDKLNAVFIIFFSISIGFLVSFIIVSIIRFLGSKPIINPFNLFPNDFSFLLGLFSLVYLVGIFPAISIVAWLKKMFPYVEIQIGPKYSFIEANRRKILVGIITIFIIPLIISLFIK